MKSSPFPHPVFPGTPVLTGTLIPNEAPWEEPPSLVRAPAWEAVVHCQAQKGDLDIMVAARTDKGGLLLPNVAQDTDHSRFCSKHSSLI